MKKVDKQNRLRWLAAVCIIWGVLIELHFTAAGQYGAGIFHYAAAPTAKIEGDVLAGLLLTLGGFAGFSLAIDGVLVLAKALKKSAMEQRSLLQNNCLISGWALLGMAVYELIVHHGLTAYRNNVPVTYFGGMEATVSLIWIPALLMGLIPLGIGLWMKKESPCTIKIPRCGSAAGRSPVRNSKNVSLRKCGGLYRWCHFVEKCRDWEE